MSCIENKINGGELPIKFSLGKKKDDYDVLSSLDTKIPVENYEHLESRVNSNTKICYSNDTTKWSPGSPVLKVAKTKDGDTTLRVKGIYNRVFNKNLEKNDWIEKITEVNFALKISDIIKDFKDRENGGHIKVLPRTQPCELMKDVYHESYNKEPEG